jgi:transmembrane sensor
LVRSLSGNEDEVEARAAAWAVRAAEAPLAVEEQQELDDWLAQDSRHLGAYIRARAIWLDTDRLAALDAFPRTDAATARKAPRWGSFAIAASLMLALLGGGIAYDRLPGRIETARAEIRELSLSDGSALVLNGGSAAQVRFNEGERRVILRDGEASFRVTHDPDRPFVVHAGDFRVTAIGTEFAVNMAAGDIEVTVAEGVVAVTNGRLGGEPRHIRRNEQFVSSQTGTRRAQLDPEEVQRQLAWRQGLLVFRGQSLGRALVEVNRYSDVPVVIDDPSLARAEFVGVFRIGDGRAFANAAAQAFNGVVVEQPDGLRLMRAPSSPSH